MSWLANIFLLVCIGLIRCGAYDAGHCAGLPQDSTQDDLRIHEDYGLCPVMYGQAYGQYSYTFEGREYHFCCPSCIEEFKKAPQKYIDRIKEFNLVVYQFGYSPKEIKVDKGDIVRLLVTSRDVQHGVYIKEYGINAVVGKGEVKKVEFVADKAGKFNIRCPVYCGKKHNKMKAKLVVKG